MDPYINIHYDRPGLERLVIHVWIPFAGCELLCFVFDEMNCSGDFLESQVMFP